MSVKGEAIRSGAAMLVIGLVVALIVADQRGDDLPERSQEPTPTVTSPATPDVDPSEPATPDPDRYPVPTPPPGLEDLVCREMQTTTSLRVLSFNTKGGAGGLSDVVEEVRAVDADLVLLQEVDRGLARSGAVDQPDAYAEALGMHAAFSANLRVKGGDYGTLVLSRHEIIQEGRLDLPGAAGTEPRGLQWVTVDVDGRLVRVYNTHLQSVGGEVRRQQARVVAGMLAQEVFPAIVGGDFNATPGSAPISTLGNVLTDSWQAGSGSEVTGRTRKIDYIFVNDHITPVRSRVARSGVSDHHRLWADVEVGPGEQCRARDDRSKGKGKR
jgi:endonuclease/exonuclease/phosphatase family metal-dependent hydrolase